MNDITREIEIMQQVTHPNIIQLYEVFEADCLWSQPINARMAFQMIAMTAMLLSGCEAHWKLTKPVPRSGNAY